MKYREVTKKLKALGCAELSNKRKGSHRNWINPKAKTVAPVPVPYWGSKDLKGGTIRGIVRELELDWEEFKKA
ncbi:MAG TPA: type II toxin-antitoxin system HicA family toxin [Pyrinomonadaceae bacterium]|jgi:predicted RNA binding protein YcfA (HicA-like mRNA interferase family)|nr:type II toxin-antitoxin system HicA family toxin [Pyrinomonadaceae bacterium]